MGKSWMIVIALAAALACAAPATADKDKDKDKGHGKGNPHADKDKDRDNDRWERREGYEYGAYEQGKRPPGWSKGKKTGWGNCGVPPGQAKKGACRAYTYNGRTHYYYTDDQGRTLVRRPVDGERR